VLLGANIARHSFERLAAFLVTLTLSLVPFLIRASQPVQAPNSAIVSPASRLSEPALFDLAEGESLKVVAQGPPGLSFDIFVYDASAHDLVGRSDDDSTEPYFVWTASRAGKYSVVLRNVGSIDGKGIVTVLPRGSKGAGDTREKGRAIVEVPYVTERQPKEILKGIQTYGAEPADDQELHYGVATVSIPRAHQMGELEGYSILRFEFSLDVDKHVVLTAAKAESAQGFDAKIRERMSTAQNQEVFVYVHGFKTSFEDGLRRAAQIKYDLNFGGVAILYSWPSHGELLAYNMDGRNADLSPPHFKAFLTQLAAVEGVKTINVIAHSMGNRVVMRALAGQTGATKLHLRHIALMAPDVDAALFRELAVSMKSTSDQITLYASSKDGALIASKLFAGYTRAGQGGSELIVMPGVLQSIDASEVDTSLLGLNHSYFADNGTILSDLYRLFRDDPAEKRFGLTEATGTAGKYWIFAARAR
jgi:esterase/lipase superfamily enzyme